MNTRTRPVEMDLHNEPPDARAYQMIKSPVDNSEKTETELWLPQIDPRTGDININGTRIVTKEQLEKLGVSPQAAAELFKNAQPGLKQLMRPENDTEPKEAKASELLPSNPAEEKTEEKKPPMWN